MALLSSTFAAESESDPAGKPSTGPEHDLDANHGVLALEQSLAGDMDRREFELGLCRYSCGRGRTTRSRGAAQVEGRMIQVCAAFSICSRSFIA